MLKISNKQFKEIIAEAVANVPEPYKSRLDNIAFIAESEVTAAKAKQLNLAPNGLLFGLYEGVSLPRRAGRTDYLPDKITIYKQPHELVSRDREDFRAKVAHTVWHEVGHYFGLSDDQIHALERK